MGPARTLLPATVPFTGGGDGKRPFDGADGGGSAKKAKGQGGLVPAIGMVENSFFKTSFTTRKK